MGRVRSPPFEGEFDSTLAPMEINGGKRTDVGVLKGKGLEFIFIEASGLDSGNGAKKQARGGERERWRWMGSSLIYDVGGLLANGDMTCERRTIGGVDSSDPNAAVAERGYRRGGTFFGRKTWTSSPWRSIPSPKESLSPWHSMIGLVP